MRFLPAAALLLWSGRALACVAGDVPDASCTPGAVYPDSKAAICAGTAGTSLAERTARALSSGAKVTILQSYGAPQHDGTLAPLVPLSLGGKNDATNIWWQRGAGATYWSAPLKARFDQWATQQVCAGSTPLATAQGWYMPAASVDWRASYCSNYAPANGGDTHCPVH